MTIETTWCGEFTNDEANRLYAEAFETRVFTAAEWDWEALVRAHSLGWVTARSTTELVGFVNVVWDGLVHAWIQDEMVATIARGKGMGRELIRVVTWEARHAGLRMAPRRLRGPPAALLL